jgi:hypothetical protein
MTFSNLLQCLSSSSISSLVKYMWVRPGAFPRVEHLNGVLLGYAPALPANVRLGKKGLPGTNALAYYKRGNLRSVKSFITLSRGTILLVLFASCHPRHPGMEDFLKGYTQYD